MHQPLVSIIIPAFNCEQYIGDAIYSCLNQTYKNIEIIIINDGSIDNTEKIVFKFIKEYENIKYFHQFNQGACVARNRGIHECKGEFVKFLDSDDVLLPNAIKLQVETILDLKNNEIVYGNYDITDNNLNIRQSQDLSQKFSNDRSLFSYFDWNIGISASLIRTQTLLEIKGFDISLPFAQESDLIIRLAIHGIRFVHLKESIFLNRQHDTPTRLRNSANYTEYWVFIKLMKKYQKLLIDTSQYNVDERLSFIDYFIFKIKGYFQLGNYKDARQALIEFSKFRPKYFREISFKTTFELFIVKIRLSFIILKIHHLGGLLKSLIKENY